MEDTKHSSILWILVPHGEESVLRGEDGVPQKYLVSGLRRRCEREDGMFAVLVFNVEEEDGRPLLPWIGFTKLGDESIICESVV